MTDERHDDEVLGRALSRAIETQTPNETPFERSRIAERPARRGFGFWQFAGVAAALVLALAFGSWFTRPTDTGPVASSPSPAATTSDAAASKSPATSAPASATPRTADDHAVIYFARDGLPPIGVHVNIALPNTAETRVTSLIGMLQGATAPAGASNAYPSTPQNLISLRGGASAVKIQGDLATLDFNIPQDDWKVRGSSQSLAVVQQLVYTATEEPGIRRVLITQNGGKPARIDQLTLDKPMSREDVFGYAMGSTKTAQGFGDATNAATRHLRGILNVDTIAPALARFVIETDLEVNSPGVSYPDFKVDVFQNDDSTAGALPGKWRLVVTVNGQDNSFADTNLTFPLYQAIDKSPVRGILTSKQGANTVYQIGLDDLRPWRTAIAFRPFRIFVDIGGDPRMINGDNAVYAPAYGAAIGHTFQVSGIAHNFEANVVIRVRDDKQKEILRTHTTATNCCDPGGTFDTTVQLPAGVTGTIYLEVLEASAKDGSDLKLIRIPLTVR